MLILTLLLAFAQPALAEDPAVWSAMHLTAQAAMDGASLAKSRAASPEIRNLGTLTARDLGDFDRRLRALAASAGIPLADAPKPAREQFEELLHTEDGSFDRKFLNFNYGANSVLRKQMHEAAGKTGSAALRDLIALFDEIVRQDEFLSGWCLGHCVQRSPR